MNVKSAEIICYIEFNAFAVHDVSICENPGVALLDFNKNIVFSEIVSVIL